MQGDNRNNRSPSRFPARTGGVQGKTGTTEQAQFRIAPDEVLVATTVNFYGLGQAIALEAAYQCFIADTDATRFVPHLRGRFRGREWFGRVYKEVSAVYFSHH